MKRLVNKFKWLLINIIPDYRYYIKKENEYVIASYITDAYFQMKKSKSLLTHGNKLESLIIRDIYNQFGLNYHAIRYNRVLNKYNFIKKYPKIIFGIEPNFIKLCNKYPSSIKVYYATGSYIEHQNKMVINRTNNVNKNKKSHIPYYRLIEKHDSAEIADYIIQIGSDSTKETYPTHLQEKILLVRQSTFDFINLDIDEKRLNFKSNNYLWFGSHGSILKGLDLLLDYFSKHKDLTLHIIGPLDEEFKIAYQNEIENYSNIIYHGYVPIYSSKINSIANICSFIIYPSGSEGGVPGSVLNMMRNGLIPIVSKYVTDEYIKNNGFIIESLDNKGVSDAIIQSQTLGSEDMLQLFQKNYSYIKENYSLKVFKQDFSAALTKILIDENIF